MARDPFDYMSAAAAAEHCKVSQAAIRKWVERGILQPVGRGARQQMLFRALDVAKAEAVTARRAGRAA